MIRTPTTEECLWVGGGAVSCAQGQYEVKAVKKNKNRFSYRFICTGLLILVAASLFFYVWFSFVSVHNTTRALLGKGNLGMAVGLYILCYLIFGREVNAFKIGVERKASNVAAQIIALFLTDFVFIFLSLAITGEFRYFWQFAWRYALLWIVQSLIISVITVWQVDLYRRIFRPLQMVEIYGDDENGIRQKIDRIDYKYHVRERWHYSREISEEDLARFDAVLINDIPVGTENRILKLCFACDKRAYFVPRISDILVKKADTLNLLDTPLFLCRNSGAPGWVMAVKRAFDVVASLMALIVLSPLLGITALAIKLNDGGPVFFRQERCTIGGKKFMIIKFRSMIVDAEKDGRSHPAGVNDDRITSVGRVIRSTRIDELPQLINILKGDMSVVGPRPERVEHVAKYTSDIPEFSFRNKVRGGLTGYAQVYGKYNTTAIDKLKMDLMYITSISLLVDLQIILDTLKILLRKESTEGFSAQSAAVLHDFEEKQSEDEDSERK